MTAKKAYMETMRLVGMEGEPPLTVSPDADMPSLVRLNANSAKAEEFWGKIDFTMGPAMARKLAEALVAAANEAEAA